MIPRLPERLSSSMPWLDTVARVLHDVCNPILGPSANPKVKDALYGTWLGHPLHPAIVQLPLGFWSSAAILDLLGMEEGADGMVRLGLLATPGAVASGVAQWHDVQELDKPRRLGALHATLNGAATGLYVMSWRLRARGSRKMGVTFSMAGLVVSMSSAWLGGDLAYELGVGVNRTAFFEPTDEWIDVLDESALQTDVPMRVNANDEPVLLVRHDGQILAIAATCTHLGGPLDEGSVDGDAVTCPWHGSVFCLANGRVIHGPATIPAPSFDVRVENGRIAVKAPR